MTAFLTVRLLSTLKVLDAIGQVGGNLTFNKRLEFFQILLYSPFIIIVLVAIMEFDEKLLNKQKLVKFDRLSCESVLRVASEFRCYQELKQKLWNLSFSVRCSTNNYGKSSSEDP